MRPIRAPRPSHVFLMLAAVLAAVPAFGGANAFTMVGPFGGVTPAIAVHPANPDVILATSGAGLYRSTNAGATWTPVTTPASSYSEYISFDPTQSDRVYMLSGQVYRSLDSGQTFSAVTNVTGGLDRMVVSGSRVYASSGIGSIYRSENGGDTWTPLPVPWNTTTGYKLYGFTAARGTDSAILFACIQQQGTFKSVDAGQNWTGPIANSPCTAQFNYAFQYAVSPADSNRVLAATSDGLFLSINGGTTWNVVYTPPFIQDVLFDPLAPGNVLGLDSLGLVMRSFDGGLNWLHANDGADLDVYNLLGGTFTGAAAGEVYIATSNGPMYSSNNGASFATRFNGIHASDIREVISSDDGTIYSMFYSGPAGIHRRSPAGVWSSADNAELITRMTIPLNVMDIATGGANSGLLYLADQGAGVWRSENGGDDWTGPLPSLVGTQVFGLDVDPTNPNVVYAVRASGGLMRSANGAQSFSNCGLSTATSSRIDHVFIARSSPNVLYAYGAYSSNGMRIFKSVDSCATWAEFVSPTGALFQHIAVDPTNHNRVFRVHLTGVDRTVDGGASWTPVAFNFGNGQLLYGTRFLIDPQEPNTLWVLNSSSTGFARSVDDGATWQRSPSVQPTGFAGFLDVAELVPTSPDTLIADSQGRGLVEYQVSLDLEAGLTLPTAAVFTGTQAQATVTVRNVGAMDASPARVTVTLPVFVTLPFIPSGCTLAGSTLTCRTGPIFTGQTVSIPLTLAVSGVATSGNVTAAVDGHEADPVFSNDSVTGSLTTVSRADLMVGPPAGATIAHTTSANLDFTLTNQGPDTAENVRLTFTTPVGLDATASTLAGGTCSVAAQLVTCTLPSLAANATAAAQLRLTGAAVGTLSVNAQAASDGVDADTDQNAAASVNVIPFADQVVELSTAATTRDVGVALPYTVTIRNLGPDTSRPIVDFTVTGATVASATTITGTCGPNAGAMRCELNDLASAGSTTITLSLTTTAAGTASVQADVVWIGSLDPVSTNNRATLNTTIVTPPPPPAPPGGSSGGDGGGGGRFDWLVLVLLAGALARRSLNELKN
jgi:hypothetical protein